MYYLDELHFAAIPKLHNHPEEANISTFPFANQPGKHKHKLHIDTPGP